jgi:Tol biopolymer transport system component
VVAARGALNLIVRDLQTGADTALTSNRATDVKGTWALRHPAWFSAGDRLLYASGGVEASSRIFEQHLGAAGAPRALVEGIWATVSRDSRTLFVIEDVRGKGRLSKRAIGADGNVGPPQPIMPDLDVDDLALSPAGNDAAIVYEGEGNRLEIDLIALAGGARQRVTTAGGTQPRFSADGRTLYYLVAEQVPNGRRVHRIVRVPLTSTASPQIGKTEAVFDDSSAVDRLDVSHYDIAPDGRLLVAVEDPASRRSRTVLVQHWPALLSPN